jgi:UPF0755 protein
MKRIIIIFLLVIILASAAVAEWGYSDLRRPVYHTKSGGYIEVPKGSSPSSVIKKLAAQGIIRHEWPIAAYLKLTGRGSRFKAGEYDFPSPITPLAVVEKLERGERRMTRLTIIEGWTRWDIAEAMYQVPQFHLTDKESALQLMDNVTLIRDLDPVATNLEGYLYPDTYEFPMDATASTVIEMMVKRFRDSWTPEWTMKASMLKASPREIVTTASLIETEAKLATDRPLVASVIYNRLQRNMPLAIDSSVIYASKLEGKWRDDGKVYKSDVERRSPYNTRIYVGLPPGPVASPGRSSLMAALNPAQTDYLYYVREPSRNDGAHNFYSNSIDFEIGVKALRKWEDERDLGKAKRQAGNTNSPR